MSVIKKLLLSITTLAGIRSVMRVDDLDLIPLTIQLKFKSLFHPDSDPVWNIRPWTYEAIFSDDQKMTSVSFNVLGSLKAIISEIGLKNVPAGVREQLLQKFPGSVFKKAYQINNRVNLSYEIEMRKGFIVQHLLFTSDGQLKFVRNSNIVKS